MGQEKLRVPLEEIVRGMQVAFWASHTPDAVAIVDGDRAVGFDELNRRANRLARALRGAGLGVDDVVAIMARNSAEWAEVATAVERTGMRLVPVNWHLAADEVAYILNDSGARALFFDTASADVAMAAAVDATALTITRCTSQAVGRPSGYDEFLSAQEDTNLPDPVFGTRMHYTSGTTGRPKGVWRDRKDNTKRFLAAAERAGTPGTIDYTPGAHRHLATGPFYHGAPGLVSLSNPLHAGITVHLMPKWDSEVFLRMVAEHRITHTHMVPIMFHRLLMLPEDVRGRYDVSSLESVRHGAAPCPIHVKARMIEWFGPIIEEYYAATEGAGTTVTSEEWLRKPGTVGKVNPPGQVRIVGPNGEEVPSGEVGTVYLHGGDKATFRYFGDETKTKEAFRGDYFTVGDVGLIDPDGYLFLTDRSIDLIISGGVNIYPAEIESVIAEHPAIRDVAVVGVPDDEWGEEVWAGIELDLHGRSEPDVIRDLRRHCAARLAGYKCPRVFRVEASLPREASGKLFKRKLRDQYRQQVHTVPLWRSNGGPEPSTQPPDVPEG